MSARGIHYLVSDATAAEYKRALMALFDDMALAGYRVTLLQGTLMIQRLVESDPATIEQADLPTARQWSEDPPAATVDQKEGDVVMCPHHRAPTKIMWNDSALVMALHSPERGDKCWNATCGHVIFVKGPG